MPNPSSYSDDDLTNRLVAKDTAGDNAAPLSISEISGLLKKTVEERFSYVRVRGELSGVKVAASGHLYCGLKDENARLDGIMWRGNVQRLGFKPEDGIEVIATGKLTTYPGRSNYQIVLESMEIAGEGALLALLAKTRARLENEGLFDSSHKRKLPFLPKTIGVVTSPTGAVIRDILHRLNDRFPSHVVVWPVLVQGQGAAEQVASAIKGFSALPDNGPVARPDLVIVARGGGSIEDLWAFNEEVVVRAIASSSIPIISAVGHETDTTLADFAADLRAPTPTAAAEIAVPVRAELHNHLAEISLRNRRAVLRPVTLGRERLAVRAQRLPNLESLLAPYTQRLDEAGERLRRGLIDRIHVSRLALNGSASRLSAPLLKARLERSRDRLAAQRLSPTLLSRPHAARQDALNGLSRVIKSLNPDTILDRGYVRVTATDGMTLADKAKAIEHGALDLHFRDGILRVATDMKATGEETQFSASAPAPALKKRAPRKTKASAQKTQADAFDPNQGLLF